MTSCRNAEAVCLIHMAMLYVNPLIKGASGTKQQCTNFGFTPTYVSKTNCYFHDER